MWPQKGLGRLQILLWRPSLEVALPGQLTALFGFGFEQLAAVVVHSPVYNVTATHFFCAPFSHIIFCSFASWYSITFDTL